MIEALQQFEFTPERQPVPDEPITVTLKPLDTAGKWEIERTMDEGTASWSGIEKSTRYIVCLKGGGLGELDGTALRRKLRELLQDPPLAWRIFFAQVAAHLWSRAILSETDAKKS